MKDINEVLREKENALAKVAREVEALRIAAALLTDEATPPVAIPTIGPRSAGEPELARKRWP